MSDECCGIDRDKDCPCLQEICPNLRRWEVHVYIQITITQGVEIMCNGKCG